MHVLKDITKLVVIGSFGKNLINDEIKLSRIKSKSGNGDGRKNQVAPIRLLQLNFLIKQTLLANNLKAVTNNLDKLAKIVTDGFAEQAKFNKSIHEDLNKVIKLNNLKH